jgi:hypothetical protein
MNQKVYMWIGTFAVVMMVYLFVAPKMVKKPGGAPPRAGSNSEQMAVAQVEAQMMSPGSATGAGIPYTLPSVGSSGFRVFPEGARGPSQPGLSFGGGSPAGFKIGQAYRGRRRRAFRGRRRRALRGFKPRNPRMNLFPFANVTMA